LIPTQLLCGAIMLYMATVVDGLLGATGDGGVDVFTLTILFGTLYLYVLQL
jgi:hypothetical protein